MVYYHNRKDAKVHIKDLNIYISSLKICKLNSEKEELKMRERRNKWNTKEDDRKNDTNDQGKDNINEKRVRYINTDIIDIIKVL